MKAVIGIDASEESLHTLGLIHRLAFVDPQLHLVHAIERLSPEEWVQNPPSANSLLTQFLKMQEKEGQEWLDKAMAMARAYNIPAETAVKYGGTVASQLLKTVQSSQADLLVIGSRDESAFGKMLIGSVGRNVVSSSVQSLCITRSDFNREKGPIDAVFATDHSPYADRCVETLLKLAPRGFRKLTIVTAYPHEMAKIMRNFLPQVPADISKWLESHMDQQNKKLRERLAVLGCAIESRVVASEPDEAIDGAMQDTGSQLLIMGAQGKGFLERLTTGSHAFRQAVAGRHSVLILRAPHEG